MDTVVGDKANKKCVFQGAGSSIGCNELILPLHKADDRL